MRCATKHRSTGTRDELGVVLVLTSIFMIAALSLTAMAVDMGLARSKRAEYQAAADAAALLATYRINNGYTPDQVSASVKALVQSNLGIATSAWPSCIDIKKLSDVAPVDAAIGNQCISYNLTPPAGQQRGARVRLPISNIDTIMGLGVSTIQVTAVAGADGNAGACDIFDPASCATTTTPPTTIRPTTTTTRPGPTTTVRPGPTTTTIPRTTTTARPGPTTTRPAPTTTVRPAPTTTLRPATTVPGPTTTVRPTTTTTRPVTTTTPTPPTTIDISF